MKLKTTCQGGIFLSRGKLTAKIPAKHVDFRFVNRAPHFDLTYGLLYI